LLVDDTPFNLVVVRGLVEKAGATVELARDGTQAVDALRADPHRFQLVLMDVQMPVMDGLAATRAIRETLGLGLPIVAMSAGATDAERAQCSEAGMNGFISRPINAAKLMAVVCACLLAEGGAAAEATHVRGLSEGDDALFDASTLLAACQNAPSHRVQLLELARNTIEAAPEQMAEARRAWENGQCAAATRELHRLRGALGAFGANRFAVASSALEAAIHAGQADVAAFGALQVALDTILAVAQRWLVQQGLPDMGLKPH
jgi:CheY-like chemotaxis protein